MTEPHHPDAGQPPTAGSAAPMQPMQPLLHDLVACLRAPTQAWSGADGQVRDRGIQGVHHGDVRVLSRAELRVGGAEPEAIAAVPQGADSALFVGLARGLGDAIPDPTVRVDRRRTVRADGLDEQVTVSSSASVPVQTEITLDLACDLAGMELVKSGVPVAPRPAVPAGDGLAWSGEGVSVALSAPGATVDVGAGRLTWPVSLPPRGSATLTWSLRAEDASAVVVAATGRSWTDPVIVADDRRLEPFVARSLHDLDALLMAVRGEPDAPFVAAGAPWFFTLFGRDSLWAARLMLPLGTELAASTLRVLARRAGRVMDDDTAEEPGKIMHELRRGAFSVSDAGNTISLPPLYYGTVDATPLWVCLLHDAWRWGLDPATVEQLLPTAQAALDWMEAHGDADGDGFLEYIDRSGHGLANQGWKDSSDSIQWRDGRLADGPIALCEVQGYAYEAARAGADLLDAFGRPGADRWREWAAALQARFREAFWVSDGQGDFPAVALDAAKQRVDTLTSNAGHLLGTGILDAHETAAVARRLASEAMDSGFGLRTLESGAARFSPLSYHGGTVWPHDTAIVMAGLARAGGLAPCASLVEGLLAASDGFDNRLPELFGGDARAEIGRPLPYPAACRPQAWAAASSVAVLQAVLGLRADVPAGVVEIDPVAPSPVGALDVSGLRVAGQPLRARTDRDGRVLSVEAAAGLTVRMPA